MYPEDLAPATVMLQVLEVSGTDGRTWTKFDNAAMVRQNLGSKGNCPLELEG